MPHSLTTQKNGYAVDQVFWEAATPHTMHLPRKWWPAAETQCPSFCWTKCLIWCLFKYHIHSQHKRMVMLLIRSSERLQLPTLCTYLQHGGQQPKHDVPVFVELVTQACLHGSHHFVQRRLCTVGFHILHLGCQHLGLRPDASFQHQLQAQRKSPHGYVSDSNTVKLEQATENLKQNQKLQHPSTNFLFPHPAAAHIITESNRITPVKGLKENFKTESETSTSLYKFPFFPPTAVHIII